MKHHTRQVSRSKSCEATTRANRIKATTRLTDYPVFGRDYGEWGATVAGYFTYSHLGIEVQLRFSQETWEWTAKAPRLAIETSFPHQTPENIQGLLNDWLLAHSRPSAPAAKLRQSTPAVQEMAQRHGIPVSVADEIMLGRGF